MSVTHDAFISYSHDADGALAALLERGLERLARPTFQLRAIDVFRDQTSLTASPEARPITLVAHEPARTPSTGGGAVCGSSSRAA